MQDFHYTALPIDVYFGLGRSAQVKNILLRHGYQKVLVITTPGQEEAVEFAKESDIDCCLALGGGSTIGLAKIIALKIHLPIVAVPTTNASSEMTAIYGLTESNLKTTRACHQLSQMAQETR